MSVDQNNSVRVGILGYGTIGRRLATAVTRQPDMRLVGVAARAESTTLKRAKEHGFQTYLADINREKFASELAELLAGCDVLLDCTPSGVPNLFRNTLRRFPDLITIVQGGESHESCDVSFNSLANYYEALGQKRIRVISCSSTGTTRLLWAIRDTVGILHAFVTLARRAADPGKRSNVPIHALLPTMGQSHHAADVNTVLPNVSLFSLSVNCPTTLSHVIWIHVELAHSVEREAILNRLNLTPRIVVTQRIADTIGVANHFRNLGRYRHDHPEVVVFGETVSVQNRMLTFAACIHMESITIPETIDCVRAAVHTQLDCWQSIRLTDESLGILHPNEKAYQQINFR